MKNLTKMLPHVGWIALSAALYGGCVSTGAAEKKPLPEDIQDGRLVQAPPPHRSGEPGKQGLLEWAQQCYAQGAGYNPIFARGGSVLVRWTADREGNLLRLEFVDDTFGRWEIDATGATMADCISLKARQGKVAWSDKIEWSSKGVAPLRFSPSEEATQPPPAAPGTPGAPATDDAD